MMTRTCTLLLLSPLLSPLLAGCVIENGLPPCELYMSSSSGSSSFGEPDSSTGIPTSESTGVDETTTGEISTTEEDGSSGSETTGSDSSTGEDGSSSSSSTGDPDPICGNWKVEAGELCDDGDQNDGDGCKSDCTRFDFEGIATEVAETDLVGWEPCWNGTYTMGALVSGIQESCSGSQLMLACRKVGSQKFGAVAHALASTIFTQVDGPLEYIQENGAAWMYYSPKGEGHLAISGLGPEFHGDCQGGYGMCWPTFKAGDSDPVFFPLGHCGSSVVSYAEGELWEKVVLQLQ